MFVQGIVDLSFLQGMDTIKKLYSTYPKDDLKRMEKEVSYKLIALKLMEES